MIGVYVIDPVYLLGSTPPKVSSPFPRERDVVGLKEITATLEENLPWEDKLLLMFGILEFDERAVGQACRAEAKKAINVLKYP